MSKKRSRSYRYYDQRLMANDHSIDMNENAFLTWTLACLKSFFSKKNSINIKKINDLLDVLLKNQNYGVFYDQKEHLFFLKKDFMQKKTQDYARYLWEDDALGPLWAILHAQIPDSDVQSVWKKMNLTTTFYQYNKKKDYYLSVPVTRHGNLDDNFVHFFLLPQSNPLMKKHLDHNILSHAFFSLQANKTSFLGQYQTRNGQMLYSGIKELSLYLKNDRSFKKSFSATSLAFLRYPQYFSSWLVQNYYAIHEESSKKTYRLQTGASLLLASIFYGSLQEDVKKYLQNQKLWSFYQALWLLKNKNFEKTLECDNHFKEIQSVKNVFPNFFFQKKPSTDNHYKKSISLMDGLKVHKIKFSDLSDKLSVEKDKDSMKIHYSLKKNVRIEFSWEDNFLSLPYFKALNFRYNIVNNDKKVKAQWFFKNHEIDLAKSRATLLTEKSVFLHQQTESFLSFPLHHSFLEGDAPCGSVILFLETEGEGEIVIKNLDLIISKKKFLNQNISLLSLKKFSWETGDSVVLDDWKHSSAFKVQGNFIHDDKVSFYLENCGADSKKSSSITIQLNGLKKSKEKRWGGWGFRLSQGLLGKIPDFFFINLSVQVGSQIKKWQWNFSIQTCEKGDLFLFSLPQSLKRGIPKEMTVRVLSSFLTKTFYSGVIDCIQFFDEKQWNDLKNTQSTRFHYHGSHVDKNLFNTLFFDHQNLSLHKDEQEIYCFTHLENSLSGYFFPEVLIDGDHLILSLKRGKNSDGFVCIQFFNHKKLILEKDLHLEYQYAQIKISLPPSIQGLSFHKIKISKVYGHVSFQKMFIT